MHMADALISPAVGGVFWVVSGALIARSARALKREAREDLVPMMGVMGAFVFAAQMINFSIPGTGSSGHLGGGLMLTLLLGPHAALLVIASVLAVQALFFADGGLLALGCNIFNLGFFPAMVAWPLFRRLIAGSRGGFYIIAAAITGLLLGSLAVVAQTILSGISELPAGTFALMMMPVHLAIGIVEGLATAAVVGFVRRARPCALPDEAFDAPAPRSVLAVLVVAAMVLGGVLSWFASSHPDGLEWSIARTTGAEEITGAASPVHARLATAQEKTAFLPDYGFAAQSGAEQDGDEEQSGVAWPAIDAGTSLSGLVGGALTMGIILLVAFPLLRKRAGVTAGA